MPHTAAGAVGDHSPMAATFYMAYLLAFLILPLLVKWGLGVPSCPAASVAEIGLAVLIWSFVPSNPIPIDPNNSPLLQIQRNQANAYLTLVAALIFPAIAALLGGALSLGWWMVRVVWRSVADRP